MKDAIKTVLNRISLCSVLCLTVLCLSGCVNVETNLSIDRQGNAVLQEQTLFKKETLQTIHMFEKDFSIDNIVSKREALNNPNIIAEKVEQDDSKGVKITKKFHDIQKHDISLDELLMKKSTQTQLDSGRFVDVNKTFFTTNYDFNFNIDMQKDIEYVHSKLTVNIPVKAKKHNATSTDTRKHIYTWKITEPVQNVSLNYTTLNIGNILLCTLPLLLVLLGLIAFVLFKQKSETIKCPNGGKTLQNIEVHNKTNIGIIAVVVAIVMFLLIIATTFMIKSSSDTAINEEVKEEAISEEVKKEFVKGFTIINQALSVDNAMEGSDSCNTPDKLQQMFKRQLRLDEAKSTDDTFVIESGMSFKVIPLNSSCDYAPNNADSKTACAEIIIDINGKEAPNTYEKDRFSVLAYKDKVICKDGSFEQALLNK